MLGGNELVDVHHLWCIHEGTLHTDGIVALQIEHITTSDELVGTHTVENGLGVNALTHLEGNTSGEVGLDGTGDDVCGRTLGSDDHVDTYGTCLLGDTGDRQLDLLTSRHDQVTILIDDHHDVRHIAMSLLGVEFALLELLVVVLDISLTGCHQQFVTGIHLHTE